MLIGGNDISNDVITLGAHVLSCVFTCSCKLSFLFPPRSQNAPESLLAGYLLDGTRRSGARKRKRLHRLKAKLISFLFKVALCCLPSSKVVLYHETFSGKGYITATVLKKPKAGTR